MNTLLSRCSFSRISFMNRYLRNSIEFESRTINLKSILLAQKRNLSTGFASKAFQNNGNTVGSQSVIAYNISERLRIERVQQLLIDFSEYQISETPRDLRDEAVLLSLKNPCKDRVVQNILLFREGSIVFWGVPYEEQKRFLYRLSPLKVDPNSSDLIQDEKEHLNFELVDTLERSRLHRDTIQLSSKQNRVDMVLDQFAISHAIVLSVKLGIWESKLDQYIESVGWVTTAMKRGERVGLTRDQVFRKTGEIYELKHRINLTSDLLDLPDIYWDRHDQEVIFLSFISYLNIRRRTTVINEKLNNCCELMNLLASHMNDKHHIRLEWMIIALIMIEVLIEFARFL